MKNSKPTLLLIVCLSIVFFSFTGCFKTAVGVEVESIVIDKSNETIKVEDTLQIVGTIIPNNASETTISWTSSDNLVATVNANGLVTGVGVGTCTITVTCDGKVALCVITVKNKAPDFKAIFNEYCKHSWANLGSDGSYLSIDTNPFNLDKYTDHEALSAISKVNEAMGLPDYLYEEMVSTNSLMGMQRETFEDIGISVSWSYHPDNGLSVNYKLINP